MLDPCTRVPRLDFVTPPSSDIRYFSIGGSVGLDSGHALPQARLAYETYGRLNDSGDNAILVCHALTGDSHIASHASVPGEVVGWWESIIGPGMPLDTDRHFVVCSNVLGGCQGSTGPWSIDPSTGRPYGMSLPIVTVRDMVRTQRMLLEHLGVRELKSVVGGSMGGMQALEWAVMYPDMVRSIVPIATCGRMVAQGIAYNEVQRQAIMADANWCNGDYYYGDAPAQGLAVARMLGMITYQSDESMDRKFGRAFQTEKPAESSWEGIFRVESYLRYQGTKLANRFDANTYLYLSKAMDLHDLGRGRGLGYEGTLGAVRAKTLVIGIDSDILFPTYQQRELASLIAEGGGDAVYAELHSPCGHDAFLIEFGLMNPILEEFISRI